MARPEDGVLRQYETIHTFHPDWELRTTAPYIVFDSRSSRFDLHYPLHAASYERGQSGVEVWRTEDARVRRLSELIQPAAPTSRCLRSTNRQRSHPKMNLAQQGQRVGGLDVLRARLLELVGGDGRPPEDGAESGAPATPIRGSMAPSP